MTHMDPLEYHTFIQGDVAKQATLNPKPATLNPKPTSPPGLEGLKRLGLSVEAFGACRDGMRVVEAETLKPLHP